MRLRVPDDPHVDVAVEHACEDLRRVPLVQLHVHGRIALPERADALGDAERDRRGDEADVETPLLAAPDPRCLLDVRTDLAQEVPAPLEERLARGRQRDAARRADEERASDQLLELADLLGERRLGHVQAAGRAAEVELLRDGDEVAQVPELELRVHMHRISIDAYLDIGRPCRTARYSSHALRPCSPASAPSELAIHSMTSLDDARAFQELNEEWISKLFTIEAGDRRTLDDPFASIVDVGGDVLIARLDGKAVGCVSLVPSGEGVYELSKMAVAPEARNRGIGRRILLAAIERARALGATSLYLGSNSALASAVHLYESVGFTHVPPERIGPMPYARANVFMELVL